MSEGAEEFDTIPPAGQLESDCTARLDEKLASLPPVTDPGADPLARRPLRAEHATVKTELLQTKLVSLPVRQVALRKLLLNDMIEEDRQLRQQGLAYARPGP